MVKLNMKGEKEMSDIWDFFTVIFTFFGLIMGVVSISAIIYCISGCAEKDELRKQQIHDCYIQEPKTKECEYILWKEELRASKNKNSDDDFVTGMLLGQAMSGGLK